MPWSRLPEDTRDLISSLQTAPVALIGPFIGRAARMETEPSGTPGPRHRPAPLDGRQAVPLAVADSRGRGVHRPFACTTSRDRAGTWTRSPPRVDLLGSRSPRDAAASRSASGGMLIRRPSPRSPHPAPTRARLHTGLWLREHYITPLITRSPNPPGSAWPSRWYTKGARSRSRPWQRIASTVSSSRGPCHGRRLARAAPRPARLHALTSYQPAAVLALPVDRRRLLCTVGAAHRRHRLAVRHRAA